MEIAFDITIDYHHNKHENSQIKITAKLNNRGIDKTHNDKILKEMVNLCSKLMFQYKFRYQLICLVLFNKNGVDNEILPELDLPITLSSAHNLTHSELDNINLQWTLENRIKKVKSFKNPVGIMK